jgi:hypothetical protein
LFDSVDVVSIYSNSFSSFCFSSPPLFDLIRAALQMIMKAGHGGNSGRFQRMQETAEVQARFIM